MPPAGRDAVPAPVFFQAVLANLCCTSPRVNSGVTGMRVALGAVRKQKWVQGLSPCPPEALFYFTSRTERL